MKSLFLTMLLTCVLGGMPLAHAQPRALDSLRHIADTASVPAARYKALLALSQAYQRVSVDSSIQIASRVWQQARGVYPALAIEAAGQLGNSWIARGGSDSSQWYLDQCHALSQQQGDEHGMGLYHNGMGRLSLSKKDFSAAEWHFRAGMHIADSMQEAVPLNAFLVNLGAVAAQIDQFKQAIGYYRQAKPYYESTENDVVCGILYANLGVMFYRLGVLDSAIGYSLKAIQLKRKLGDRQGLCISYSALAEIYKERKEWGNSLKNHYKSIEYGKEVGNLNNNVKGYNSISEIYIMLDSPKNALVVLDSGLAIANQGGMELRRMDLNQTAGHAYQLLKQYRTAIQHYEAALAIAQQHRQAEETAAYVAEIAHCYRKLGNKQRAKKWEEKAKAQQ